MLEVKANVERRVVQRRYAPKTRCVLSNDRLNSYMAAERMLTNMPSVL